MVEGEEGLREGHPGGVVFFKNSLSMCRESKSDISDDHLFYFE